MVNFAGLLVDVQPVQSRTKAAKKITAVDGYPVGYSRKVVE